MLSIFVTGVVTGFALIVAVGAQNAFVLRQGIRGEHVLPIVVVCMVSDVVAITVGVAGFGVVLERWPAVLPIAQIGRRALPARVRCPVGDARLAPGSSRRVRRRR